MIVLIQFQAYNSRGSGPASEAVTSRTLEDAPTLPPENVQCSVLSAQSLHISWEPPLVEGQNGIIQGYKVTYHSVGEWFGKHYFPFFDESLSKSGYLYRFKKNPGFSPTFL